MGKTVVLTAVVLKFNNIQFNRKDFFKEKRKEFMLFLKLKSVHIGHFYFFIEVRLLYFC